MLIILYKVLQFVLQGMLLLALTKYCTEIRTVSSTILLNQADAWPDGRYDTRSSWITKDYTVYLRYSTFIFTFTFICLYKRFFPNLHPIVIHLRQISNHLRQNQDSNDHGPFYTYRGLHFTSENA